MEYCRVCLRESNSHESFNAEYREQFFQVTSVYIDESEADFICQSCLKCLLLSYKFRVDAIQADLWFRERIYVKQDEPAPPEISPQKRVSVKNRPKLVDSESNFYICDKCAANFLTKQEILRHMRNEHIQKEFICPESHCDKRFSGFREYRKHVKTHLAVENISKWICEYCAKSFNSKYKLTLHSRSHTNVRPYKCSQCTASFKQQTDLNTHVKSLHSDDRPFSCKDCGMSFKIPNSLRSHRKRKHHQEGMLTCSECHKKVMCSSELKEHMAIYHRGERNHACRFCPKTYTKAYHVRRHMQDVHRDLYEKLVSSGELRTVNRSAKSVQTKVEIVETPQTQTISIDIDNATFAVLNY